MSKSDDTVIYDFETLATGDPRTGTVLSLGMLSYERGRFLTNPYEYEELVDKASYYKFDVADQVKRFGRVIEKDTLEWWKSQKEPEAKAVLKPSAFDIKIDELLSKIEDEYPMTQFEQVFTRGNRFDPEFLTSICGKDPFYWWAIRDTRSYIDGFLYGTNVRNDFVPEGLAEKFVKHDARHDVAMDVMRMQYLHQETA